MSCPPRRCGCIRCEGLRLLPCTVSACAHSSWAIRLPAGAPFPQRVRRSSAVRRLAADSVTIEVRQWGLKVSWQRLVPLSCRLAFAAPVGVLGLCALCWANGSQLVHLFPFLQSSVSCPCLMRPAVFTNSLAFLPARVYARQRVHGVWARGRGLPRLRAPLSGQAPVRRSAKPSS